ncbi:MAG TPA: hypothetical protein VMG10_00970 [Gemmataceae bacterium]|nr:hypothetical protein [Gemmataceae bacterium]
MNLLCPNCQKMLTVAEEFAGQLMKCPLCSGTFTVPGLPGAAPPPAAPPQPEQNIYTIRQEPVPPPSPPAPPLSHLEPPPSTGTTTKPTPPKPSLPPEDYQHTYTAWLNPKVLPWIAPACLLLVFVFQLFDWDGLYPGGVPAMTGNAWSAAFGTYSVDGDLKNRVDFKSRGRFIDDEKHKPGASILTIFYLLLFFPVLVVTIGSVVMTMVPIKLPPQVEQLLPWRWGIVAAANLILFLFLGLQVLLGFSLDSRYKDWVDSELKRETKENPTTQQRKEAEVDRGELLEMSRHTFSLRLVVLLHLVAIVSTLLMFWINQRGTHRPLPKLELRW